MAARIAMIAITTSNSISVKPAPLGPAELGERSRGRARARLGDNMTDSRNKERDAEEQRQR
jgi:hypothetical protein